MSCSPGSGSEFGVAMGRSRCRCRERSGILEIWDSAMALAHECGICRVSRTLTIDHSVLRRRAEAFEGHSLVRPTFAQCRPP